MAKFCGKCGAPLGAGGFCPQCGAYFGSQQSASQHTAYSSALPMNKKRGHKGFILLVALVFVVVFACSAVLILGAIRADLPAIITKKETRFDQLIYDPELTVTEAFTPRQVFPFDAVNVSDHNGADSIEAVVDGYINALITCSGNDLVKLFHQSSIDNSCDFHEFTEQEFVDYLSEQLYIRVGHVREYYGDYTIDYSIKDSEERQWTDFDIYMLDFMEEHKVDIERASYVRIGFDFIIAEERHKPTSDIEIEVVQIGDRWYLFDCREML